MIERNGIMKHTYKDKHGKEIRAGMTIRHDNGDNELVYNTMDAYGDDILGILATNPDYIKYHPDCELEYYPLSNFDMREWEIVE